MSKNPTIVHPLSVRLHATEKEALVDLAAQWEMRGPSAFAHFVLSAIASGDAERVRGLTARLVGEHLTLPFVTFADQPAASTKRAILKKWGKGGRKRERRT